MKINFIDFRKQYETVKEEIDSGLKKVFEKSNFILGEEERKFEEEFAKYCGARFGVGVNSGTDALYFALAALDIGPGDEVILPTFTFIATALCVSYAGAKPVFVDIEKETYNLDPKEIKNVITKKTKAIIAVHLYGQPAHMNEITALAKEHNIAVVEDACQAHGAMYHDKRVGVLGDAACFSFYPTKSLGAFGDGGMVVTNNEIIAQKVGMLRDYGRSDRYAHTMKGYNSRLDTVQAVVLSAKLKYLDRWNQMRKSVSDEYAKRLKDVDGIIIPSTAKGRTHVFQTYAVCVPNRDHVLKEMQARGIGVLIHYPIPIHLQEAYKDVGYKEGDFPVSEEVAKQIISLPMYPHMTKEEVEYVCQNLKSIIAAQEGVVQ